MIYKDKHGEIHLIGDDKKGISLSSGYYKDYRWDSVENSDKWIKLNELVIKQPTTKQRTISVDGKEHGFYIKDRNNIIYNSRNGKRLIKSLKGFINGNFCSRLLIYHTLPKSYYGYITIKNKPVSIKIKI